MGDGGGGGRLLNGLLKECEDGKKRVRGGGSGGGSKRGCGNVRKKEADALSSRRGWQKACSSVGLYKSRRGDWRVDCLMNGRGWGGVV